MAFGCGSVDFRSVGIDFSSEGEGGAEMYSTREQHLCTFVIVASQLGKRGRSTAFVM